MAIYIKGDSLSINTIKHPEIDINDPGEKKDAI